MNSVSITSQQSLVYFAPGDIQVARVDRNCIVKFCEAMQASGSEVTLVSMKIRAMSSEPTSSRSLWDVFGVNHRFNLVKVPLPVRQERLDTRLTSLFLRTVRATAYPIVGIGLSLRHRLKDQATVLYCKNAGLLPGLAAARIVNHRSALVLFEAHVPPRNRFQRWALGRADGLVCNGAAIHEHLLKLGIACPNRSMAVHQGYTADRYTDEPGPKLRAQARHMLGWEQGDKFVVYTGKVTWPHRELELLLEMARLVSTSGIRLVIVGGRQDKVELWRQEMQSRGLDNVVFHGFVAPSEIPRFQHAADVLVSYYPSDLAHIDYLSPGKLFEYMASGSPIVAADHAALREVLIDGQTAILVRPDRPECLASAVVSLFDNQGLAKELGERARRESAKYTWDARASTISAFIRELGKS